MEQLQLLLRDQKRTASIDAILACPTFKESLKLCKSMSGLEDKQLAMTLEIDQGQWARIFGNGGHFPENKLMEFMDLCQNKVPLIWLAHHCGYGLHPLMDEKDRQIEELQEQLAEAQKELEVVAKWKQKGLI